MCEPLPPETDLQRNILVTILNSCILLEIFIGVNKFVFDFVNGNHSDGAHIR